MNETAHITVILVTIVVLALINKSCMEEKFATERYKADKCPSIIVEETP